MRLGLVTGTSRGLGKAIRVKFMEAGIAVPECSHLDLNLAYEESIAAFVDRFDAIDILVNNAAILGPVGPLAENPWNEWRNAIAVDLLGPTFLLKVVLPRMPTGGKIITIAGGGASGPLPRRSAYASAKAALVRLTECVAEERPDLMINSVLPGPLPTDMLDDILAAGERALGQEEHQTHLAIKNVASGAAIERAASLVAWLASSESDGLTGRMISARFDPWPFDRSALAKIMDSDEYTLRRVDRISK